MKGVACWENSQVSLPTTGSSLRIPSPLKNTCFFQLTALPDEGHVALLILCPANIPWVGGWLGVATATCRHRMLKDRDAKGLENLGETEAGFAVQMVLLHGGAQGLYSALGCLQNMLGKYRRA